MPQCLRRRPYETIRPDLFQLGTMASVQQVIVRRIWQGIWGSHSISFHESAHLAVPKVGLALVDKRFDAFAHVLSLEDFGEQVSLDLHTGIQGGIQAAIDRLLNSAVPRQPCWQCAGPSPWPL